MSTAEGNSYLIDRFGSRQDLFQFRIIDAYSKETNLLEQGSVVFKKILFAGTDEMFNKVRNNLNVIKLERERLCKDDVVLDICYPSMKRLEVLNASLNETVITYQDMERDISETEVGLRKSEIKLTSNEGSIKSLNSQILGIDALRTPSETKIIQNESRIDSWKRNIKTLEEELTFAKSQTDIFINSKICYVCKQPIETKTAEEIKKDIEITRNKKLDSIKNYKKEILNLEEQNVGLKESIIKERLQKVEQFKEDIKNLEQENIDLAEDIKNTKEILAQDKEVRNKLLPKKEKIQSLKVRLENRLKQRQFIYTKKDVIVVKKAIEELDKLSSVYLVETVGSLEPIINSVLERIGFQLSFDCDIKGKFNIILTKEDVQYKYSDLSCGQRLILQIALKLALLMQQNKSGLILSDEGLSALENNNLEDIINLFKELNFQLIFVLHRASIEDNEVNIIKIGAKDEKEI